MNIPFMDAMGLIYYGHNIYIYHVAIGFLGLPMCFSEYLCQGSPWENQWKFLAGDFHFHLSDVFPPHYTPGFLIVVALEVCHLMPCRVELRLDLPRAIKVHFFWPSSRNSDSYRKLTLIMEIYLYTHIFIFI